MTRNLLKMTFVCLFTVGAISFYDRDDDEKNGSIPDNTIIATVENGSNLNGKVDSVMAMIVYQKSNGGLDYYVVASAPYSNSGFILKLPENVNDSYLGIGISRFIDILDGITVSNPNVKIGAAMFIDAYKAGDNTGYFYHGIADWKSMLMYVNGDLSITGSDTNTGTLNLEYHEDGLTGGTYTYTYKYNVHLKKGWNMVYTKTVNEESAEKGNYTIKNEYEATTTVPSGTKWYFVDNSSDPVSSRIKKVPFLSK
jgi:hypothetical protein